MAEYRVELEGNVREVYTVEADSPEEAARNWMHGSLEIQESYGCGVVDVSEYDA